MGQPVSDNTLTSYIESSRYTKTTRGTETSKYPEEEKAKAIPLVAASETGEAQTNSTELGLRTSKKNGWLVE